MSSALVKQSLALIDEDFKLTNDKQKIRKQKNVKDLIPENHKLYSQNNLRSKSKRNLLETHKKLSILEARKTIKTKEEILQQNKKKLEKIKKICKVNLDKRLTSQIIARAVSKRPIKNVHSKKKSKKTVFTEEDFKNFEEEYINDDN